MCIPLEYTKTIYLDKLLLLEWKSDHHLTRNTHIRSNLIVPAKEQTDKNKGNCVQEP